MDYKWVTRELEALVKLLGAEMGAINKRERQEMREHVASETALVRRLVELERRNVERQVEDQAKTIESLRREVKTIKAQASKPRQQAEPEQYRPTMANITAIRKRV
jgi:hypothetical protein